MIVCEEDQDVETSGTIESSGFTILASTKAFNILSSNVYTNKVRAVIRELSTNAHDAHVDAGSVVPFKIHLPTCLEPVFTVRDYGTGISHENMMGFYTQFFKSTRIHSNDFCGALGIGRMSPFCIVDSFTVTSYYNGDKKTYCIFKNKHGVPEINLLISSETDEPNGLEVSLSVEKSLIEEFKEEAAFVFATFEQLPIINVDDVVKTVNDQKFDVVVAGKYKLKYARYENLYAVMGNVAYEIDSKYTDIFTGFSGYVYFDIGELSFNPGRENLSYDKKTIDALTNKLNQYATAISQEILDIFKGETNKFIRFQLAQKHTLPLFKMDKELEAARSLQCKENYTVYTPDYGGRRVSTYTSWTARTDVKYYKYQKGYEKRIKSFVKTNKVKVAVVNDDQIKELDIPAHLLNDPATLPKIAYTRSSASTTSYKPDANAYKISVCYYSISDVATSSFTSQKIYVEFYGSGKSIVNAPSWCNTIYKICYIIKYLESIGINVEVHAIRSGAVATKNFNKDGSWTRFSDFVQEKLDKHTYKQYNLKHSDRQNIETLHEIYEASKDERLKFTDEIKSTNSLLDDVVKMMDFVNAVVIDDIPELNSVMDKYPMFKIINTYKDNFEQICVDYMNSVDRCQNI